MKDVVIITGPTASGKSGLALDLADHIDCELISADSMQIYRGMDIGTAKPTQEERAKVKHHMIDIVNINEPFSVSQFQEKAFDSITLLHAAGKTPVIVGGTGLYINSVVYKIDFTNTQSDPKFRNQMKALKEKHGLRFLYDKMEAKDPAAALRIHPNDEKRIIRRLEILSNETDGSYNFERENTDYNFKIFALNLPREILYDRINKRVDIMINAGLVEEVEALYRQYGEEHTALKAIGYKEIIAALKGETDMDTAVRLIKQSTRRFAKRQITWFKRNKRIVWLDGLEKSCLKTLLNGLE